MEKQKDVIRLGSGDLYHMEFTGTLPENNVIETEENRLGYIQGGASIEYKPEFYEAKDDKGIVSKEIITEEETLFKTGILTFNGNSLATLSSTARVEEDTAKGLRTLKIGGTGNHNGKRYVIHFVHRDSADGDVRITIVGTNRAGFTLTFNKDKETVIDAEFKAQPQDSEGTLIRYIEEIPAPVVQQPEQPQDQAQEQPQQQQTEQSEQQPEQQQSQEQTPTGGEDLNA